VPVRHIGRPTPYFGIGEKQGMDLTRATSLLEIGPALDHAGMTWSYDDDGDVRIRFRSGQQPWIDVVFYRFDAQDFSMRGQFLNGRAVPQANGMTRWEVPLESGHTPTAVAQKVVTIYLMPRPGGVSVQIHAAIAPLEQPRPMHIKIRPEDRQVSRIEKDFPGFVRAGDSKQVWMSTRVGGTRVAETDFCDMVMTAAEVGLAMFDGPFTGWLFPRDV
jgi:hypothetical protein